MHARSQDFQKGGTQMSDVHVVYRTRAVGGHLYQVCASSNSKNKEAAAACTSMLAVPFP